MTDIVKTAQRILKALDFQCPAWMPEVRTWR
jgi:hypothetical protein